jgi:hypothetical protein
MMKAHEEWLKAHQLKMKKAGEEFELAYQGVGVLWIRMTGT